jgi:hypothetical protein
MKKILIFTLYIAFGLSIAYTGCKKYDDGPFFILSSKKGRVEGNWKFKKYIYAGNNFIQSYATREWKFKKDGAFTEVFNGIEFPGSWKFILHKKAIDMTNYGNTELWTITRLTKDEMWLESIDLPLQEVQLTSE